MRESAWSIAYCTWWSFALPSSDKVAVIREIVQELTAFIEERPQTVSFVGPEALTLMADRDKLFLVLMNVIQNAIKFSFDGGHIQIDFARQGQTVRLARADSGSGSKARNWSEFLTGFTRHPTPPLLRTV